MYRPFFITVFITFFILLVSCAPVNNIVREDVIKTKTDTNSVEMVDSNNTKVKIKFKEKNQTNNTSIEFPDEALQNNVTIVLSKKDKPEIVNQFINVIELAVYQKKIKNISFSIELYENKNQLNKYLKNQNLAGKVFIGPLSSIDTETVEEFCFEGAIFFSFSPNTELAKKCTYLVNFFPENELKTVFSFFPDNSKIALLYPENEYGFKINSIIDKIANQSNSIIVNRASYNEDLTNAPEAIKELGKYELRKYELNRQKRILASKKDKESKKRLIKIEKFQTTKDFDFTHIIIADYGLRLLQVAPLLPYYDIDPNVVRFVGTGAWDDEVFYDEPSLHGSIYPGIEYSKRQKLYFDYQNLYGKKLLRTSTLPYDLVGLLDYLINNNFTTLTFYEMFKKNNIKFAGIDGNFYFNENKIERDLQILQIEKGDVKVISKQE